jgi:hypothetical protein
MQFSLLSSHLIPLRDDNNNKNISDVIYLSANLTAQKPIIKLPRVRTKKQQDTK